MRIGKISFKPGFIPTVATILLLLLLVKLGFWQLGRADFKYKIRADRGKNTDLPIVNLTENMTSVEKMVERKVRLHGQFVSNRKAALANITYKNNPGFFVIQPFKLAGSDQHILVVRGWIRQYQAFNIVPAMPETPVEELVLTGIVDRKPVVGIEHGEPDAGFSRWPKLLSYININWYQKKLMRPFLPYVVKEYGAVKALDYKQFGLTRDWKYFSRQYEVMPPEKHVSYAVQWFLMALVLFGIFIGVNTKKINNSKSSTENEV